MAWSTGAWLIALFVTVSLFVAILVGSFFPSGPVWGGAALLVGATAVGSALLLFEGTRPAVLGFYLGIDSIRESGLGLVLGIAVGVSVVGLLAVTGGLEWVEQDLGGGTWITGAMAALLFFVLPAAAEEALLRGYPLVVLRRLGGVGVAVAVTSSVFGLLHLGNPGAGVLSTANVVLAGVWLGVITVRTRSLWWATGAHIGWNWSHGFVADVPVSGLEVVDAPGYEGVPIGPEWWGGGAFGPEGSVASTLVLIAATVVCWKARWLRPGPAAARLIDEREHENGIEEDVG